MAECKDYGRGISNHEYFKNEGRYVGVLSVIVMLNAFP